MWTLATQPSPMSPIRFSPCGRTGDGIKRRTKVIDTPLETNAPMGDDPRTSLNGFCRMLVQFEEGHHDG